VFRDSKIVLIDEMTLTGTATIRHMTPEMPITIRPMEIKTWKIVLQ